MCTAWERARWSVWDDAAALLPRNYIDAVHRAGGLAVLLPPDPTLAERPEQVLDLIDGVMLAGGADIDPDVYDAERHDETVDTVPDRDAFEISRRTGCSWSGAGASSTFAPGVRSPNGFTPLKTFCALPSHCWRKLKTALSTVGALRGVTWRTLLPPTEKTLSGTGTPASTAEPGTT